MNRVLAAIVTFMSAAAPAIAQEPATMPASAVGLEAQYVVVKDGHLTVAGNRVRFWGCVGNFPGKTYADNEAVARRLADVGFNMVRFWRAFNQPAKYVSGDLSDADRADHFLECLRKNGIRVWLAGMGNVGTVAPEDVGIVDDPATAELWKSAIVEMSEGGKKAVGLHGRDNPARIWDRRLETLAISRMKNTASHESLHSGMRWADDPNIAIWELSNEEWWFKRMNEGRLNKLPAFFIRELLDRWNAFLRAKYGSEDKLRRAWLGLLEGESLDKGTVLLLPLKTPQDPLPQKAALRGTAAPRPATRGQADTTAVAPDANPANAVTVEAVALKLGPDDFNGARAADVIEFLLKIWVEHKQREADAVKPLGRSTRLCPLIWDTGIGNEMQSQYMLQHGDAIAHCEYQQGIGWDPTDRRFPWHSMLDDPPRLAPNREWETVEHTRHPSKPFLLYENQIHNPAKYRGEYPMLVASLAGIQDWDAVVWHYFGPAPDSTLDRPYEHAMDYSSSEFGHPQGFHFQYDEVQMSAMRAAASVFRTGALEPAPKPTTFIFGSKSLHDVRMINYGRVGDLFLPTTYRYGVRLLIDPARPDDQIIGPTYDSRYYEPNPYAPTGQIVYDRQKACLTFDSPSVAMFTGFFAQAVCRAPGEPSSAPAGASGSAWRFRNGTALSGVSVVNPEGIAYPVREDEKYVTFALVADDGAELAKSRHMTLSCMSTSFNSGFKLDQSKLRERFWWSGKGATVSLGKLPVLVARVAARVESPALSGCKYRMLDWHMNELASGTVEGATFDLPADKPVFIVEFTR